MISCVRQFSCLEYHDYPQLGPENANTSTSYYKDLNITQYQCGPGYESEFGKGTLLQARHTAKLPDQDFIFHYSGLSVMESEMTCIGDSRGNRSQEVQACDEAYMKNYHKLGMCKYCLPLSPIITLPPLSELSRFSSTARRRSPKRTATTIPGYLSATVSWLVRIYKIGEMDRFQPSIR